MTSTIPSPADFMAMTDGPDFDVPDFDRGIRVPDSPRDWAQTVSEQLDRIEQAIELPKIEKAANEAQQQRIEDLEAEISELSDLFDGKQALIAEVLEAIKKSTSQVANKVRAILEPEPLAPLPTEPPNETEPVAISEARTAELAAELEAEAKPMAQPADDAPVEVWRQFVRGRKSFLGVDVDQLNKSQIRTMLQLPHPSEGQAADQSAEG